MMGKKASSSDGSTCHAGAAFGASEKEVHNPDYSSPLTLSAARGQGDDTDLLSTACELLFAHKLKDHVYSRRYCTIYCTILFRLQLIK